MRLLALVAQFAVLVASGGSAAWWLNSRALRLLVRRLERGWPLRHGPLGACRALLLAAASLMTALTAGLGWLVYRALRGAPGWLGAGAEHWSAGAWHAALCLVLGLVVLSGAWAAFGEALAAIGDAVRLRHLAPPPDPPPRPDATPQAVPPAEGRRIVILCDGTSNRPDQQEDGEAAATNVWKLYRALGCDETQVTWYQAGVGSDTSSSAAQVRRTRAVLDAVGAKPGGQVAALGLRLQRMWESAFGAGIGETILRGYAEIVRQYRPGDRIYLVGFSRGAYAARCIAGVISRCGLLRAENLRYAPEMVRLYRTRARQEDAVRIRPEMVHADPDIHFLGVFDTVASLGAPLWGWWFRVLPIWRNAVLSTDPAGACRHVYHALSMDERRAQFFPTLFERPAPGGPSRLETLEQVWFRGAHADVGGGYARHDLSDIALGWMMHALRTHGLRFHPEARAALRPDPLGRLHDELARRPYWRLFGTWPRWHPVPGGDGLGTRLHGSVLRRADAVTAGTGRPDLLRLAPGQAQALTVEARRDWDRTGLVVERGAAYRLAYLGGLWRDAGAPACGPAGQEAGGALDLRRWLRRGRRLPGEPWMRLVATVAHPRRWPLREKGFPELLRVLFDRDPEELRAQLAPLGRDLGEPGDAVVLHSAAPSGLLHLFANDLWQTAENNSGGPRLELTRLDGWDARLPSWRLDPAGAWSRHAPGTPAPEGW